MLRIYSRVRLIAPLRYIHSSLRVLNVSVQSKNKEKDLQLEAKKKLKRAQAVKLKNKQPPEIDPLYMEIPVAMKYLRAAEVGQPAKKTTVSILMSVIPDKGSKPLAGSIAFPRPLKDSLVMVLSENESVLNRAKEMGAALFGGQDLIDSIKDGNTKLDHITHCFATPGIVKELKPVARILGVRGIMPTARRGTVSDDVESLISGSIGSINFKQKDRHLSIPIGRCDFSDKEILENLKAASDAIYGSQPPGTKRPNLIGRTFLSSTIGPSILINFKN
ncbi:uncharacterized protein PRCAT00002427001 [Priceomyces carsonii]|uniref:uncharacterized protein n=1 Tax=Priceomyces carsonii TaxID=28549 RepID=UPI002ED7A0AD|nr:unnamed protein product [Priceomyces carsonii]